MGLLGQETICTLGLSVGQHSFCPLHMSFQQLGGPNLTGFLGRGYCGHFGLRARRGAAGHTGEILGRKGPKRLHPTITRLPASPLTGIPSRPTKEVQLCVFRPQERRLPLPEHNTSEPEGDVGSRAAGEAGRLPRSGISKARSLRAKSRGFFFFSAS